MGEPYYPKKAAPPCVIRDYLQSRLQSACETHTGIIAKVLLGHRDTPTFQKERAKNKLATTLRQGILEPAQLGGIRKSSIVVWQRDKTRVLTLCMDLRVYIMEQINGRGFSNPKYEDYVPQSPWALIVWQNRSVRQKCQIELDKDAKKLHNPQISSIFQDEQASSGLEELFINLPEFHRVNCQRNQVCRHFSRHRTGIGNNDETLR